jgi:hypothetical protein
MPHKSSKVLMLLVPTAFSVLTVSCLLQLVDTEMVSAGESILFWVPLFCCILFVIFSANRIYRFLHREAPPEEFIIK